MLRSQVQQHRSARAIPSTVPSAAAPGPQGLGPGPQGPQEPEPPTGAYNWIGKLHELCGKKLKRNLEKQERTWLLMVDGWFWMDFFGGGFGWKMWSLRSKISRCMMCSICETIWTDNIENGWTLIEKTGGKVSFWKRHRWKGWGWECWQLGFISRRLPLAPRACRVKMGLRVINPLWIANSSRPAATSVKFAPARRRQNTQRPGWRLNMSFATLWRGWRRLEKTIGMLESACILIFVLEDVFFLKLCWDTNSNLWDIFKHFSWKADFMRPKRSQNPRKKRKKNAKTANGEEVEHSD